MYVFFTAPLYNKFIGKKSGFNSLAAAFSITDRDDNVNFDLDPDKDIGIAFIEKAKEFGMSLKEIDSPFDIPGNTGFLVFGYYEMVHSVYGCEWTSHDYFHVVRFNPDGTFFHRPDAHSPSVDFDDLFGKELQEYEKELHSGNYRAFVVA